MKKLIQWVRISLSVFGIERLKKRAIKNGYCKPDGDSIDYPRKGVKVV